MNIIMVRSGKAEICKENGTLVRSIMGNSDVIHAFLSADQSLVLITTKGGKVEIRKDNGTLVREMCNGEALMARWQGNDIAVLTNKGKTELRKENGTVIRIL